MRKLGLFASALILGLASLVACTGELGEGCDEEGRVSGECDEGLVCGRQTNATELTCLKQCNAQTDCGEGEVCSGVGQGSLTACRTALR